MLGGFCLDWRVGWRVKIDRSMDARIGGAWVIRRVPENGGRSALGWVELDSAVLRVRPEA